MKKEFADKTATFVNKYYNYQGKDYDKLHYGLQVMYTLLTKCFAVLILAFFLNIFYEALILLLLYGSLRIFGFGLHAKKNINCWIGTLLIYIILPILSNLIVFPIYLYISLIAFSLISFILFAPADTEKKPLINPKKRLFSKIMIIVISCLLIILIYFIDNNVFRNLVLFAFLMQAAVINPIVYYLVKAPYANYKNFKKV